MRVPGFRCSNGFSWTSGLGLAVMVFSVSCGGARKKPGGDTGRAKNLLKLSAQAVANAKLSYHTAGPASLARPFSVNGEIHLDGSRVTRIVAGVSGVVRALKVSQGSDVKKGAELAVIESRELATLKLSYLEGAQRVAIARRAYNREATLYKRKLATKDTYLKRKGELQSAGLSLRTDQQKLRVLGVDTKEILRLGRQRGKALTRYTLRAPFGGRVLSVSGGVGSAVEPKKALLVVADLSHVWGESRVQAHLVAGLVVGQTVRITNRRLGLESSAKILYVSPVADRATRTVLVRLAISNIKGQWRPGCVLQAHFATKGKLWPVVVPRSAVHLLEKKAVVFRRRDPTTFEVRKVVLGPQTDQWVAITEGLAAGDHVAADNSFSLKAEFQKRSEE